MPERGSSPMIAADRSDQARSPMRHESDNRQRFSRAVLAVAAVLIAALAGDAAQAATGDLFGRTGTGRCLSFGYPDCLAGPVYGEYTRATVSPDGRHVYATAFGADSIAAFDRDPATGKVTWKGGADGCYSSGGDPCTEIEQVDGPLSVAVSPDGKNVYVAADEEDVILVFDRNLTTGALKLKAGAQGCVGDQLFNPDCTPGPELFDATALTVSGDGKHVYTTYDVGLATFDRAADGALTLASCMGYGEACSQVEDGYGANAIVVAPDGRNVYTTRLDGLVVAYDRNAASGRLTKKTGTGACAAALATVHCLASGGLRFAAMLAVSPDGRNLYVVSGLDKVTVFRREPGGALSALAGTDHCVTLVMPVDCAASRSRVYSTRSIVISADGASVYTGSEFGITQFDRDPESGRLSRKPGESGCVGPTIGCRFADIGLVTELAVAPGSRHVYAFTRLLGARMELLDRQMTPVATIESGPQGVTDDATPTFTFASDTPGSRFECALDGGAFIACSNPYTSPALANGAHSLQVRAIDRAGNVGEASASRAFNIAAAPPSGSASADTTVDATASARKTQRQKRARISIGVTVQAREPLTARGTGNVKVGRRSFALSAKASRVRAGVRTRLTFTPKRKADGRRIATQLARRRTAKAMLTVTLTDAVGNRSRKTLRVTLKP